MLHVTGIARTRTRSRNLIVLSGQSQVTPISAGYAPLSHRASLWIMPWDRMTYPGHQRGVLRVLSGAVTWGAVKHWRAGRRTFPAWAARALADHIAGRCEIGLRLVAELRSHADAMDARPKRLVGFCAVDDAGKDSRGNWRR